MRFSKSTTPLRFHRVFQPARLVFRKISFSMQIPDSFWIQRRMIRPKIPLRTADILDLVKLLLLGYLGAFRLPMCWFLPQFLGAVWTRPEIPKVPFYQLGFFWGSFGATQGVKEGLKELMRFILGYFGVISGAQWYCQLPC